METYDITIRVTTETEPKDWHYGDVLIIDEEYQIVSIKSVEEE